MLVSQIMTTRVQVVGPQESLQHAAQLMDELNVGALPVCAGSELLGMVTDRDITVRGTASGYVPNEACVSDVMSPNVECCTEDQDTDEVMHLMSEAQVRRLPVLNRRRELVGIVSLGDMATKQPDHVDDVVREISTPSEPDGAPEYS
jgi:CBS domain-containing protein